MSGNSALSGSGCASPLVSVIVPCFNGSAYLEECLDSIIGQTYDKLEIIYVDDYSTDASPEIARRMLAGQVTAQVVECAHGGVSRARNEGMSRATGDYLLFVDADDLLPADAVEHLVAEALATNADMVYGCHTTFSLEAEWDSHELDGFAAGITEPRGILTSLASGREESVKGYCFRILYRTAFLAAHAITFPCDMSYCEDVHFILDCLEADPCVAITDEVVYRLRRGSSSVTTRYNPQMRSDTDRLNRRLWQICAGDPELESLYHHHVALGAWMAVCNEFRHGASSRPETMRRACECFSAYRTSIDEIPLRDTHMSPVKLALLKLGTKAPYISALAIGVLYTLKQLGGKRMA